MHLLRLFSKAWILLQKNKMLCYRKDNRAMRPIYKLPVFHTNFFHAYGHCTLRGFDYERIKAPEILFISAKVTFRPFKVIRGH